MFFLIQPATQLSCFIISLARFFVRLLVNDWLVDALNESRIRLHIASVDIVSEDTLNRLAVPRYTLAVC